MEQWQTNDQDWIACPKCRIANLRTSIHCSACGAVLDPNAPPPKYPSGASPKQWVLVVGICGVLIAAAIWAGVNPNSIAGKAYSAYLPAAYFTALLLGFGRTFMRFRSRDFTGGFLQCALTILFALAALPAVFNLVR